MVVKEALPVVAQAVPAATARRIGRKIVGEKHPIRRPVVGALAAGGIIAGLFHGIHLDASINGHVNSRAVKGVEIDLPTITMASFRTHSCVSTTEALKNPLPGINLIPGAQNLQSHSQDKCADVVSTINIKATKLVGVKPDSHGIIDITLVGNPNPKTSDVSLTEAIDPGTEKVNTHGDLTDPLFQSFFGQIKAWAQVFGKAPFLPTDSITTILTKTNDQLLYDSVSSGPKNCSDRAIPLLNTESVPKTYNYVDPNPPKTLNEAIGRFVYSTYTAKTHQKISGVNVHWQLDPAGLPNEFSHEIAEARTSGAKGFKEVGGVIHMTISMTDPSKYPPCGDAIPNAPIVESK